MNTITGTAEDRTGYRRVFDKAVTTGFQQALRIVHTSPALLLTGTTIALYQKKATRQGVNSNDRDSHSRP